MSNDDLLSEIEEVLNKSTPGNWCITNTIPGAFAGYHKETLEGSDVLKLPYTQAIRAGLQDGNPFGKMVVGLVMEYEDQESNGYDIGLMVNAKKYIEYLLARLKEK